MSKTQTASNISPKVTAATAGAGVAVALTTVVAWAVEQTTGIQIPGEVQGAFSIVLGALGAFVAGFWKVDPARQV